MSGSYVVISLKGKDLTSTPINMSPLYDKIKGLNKPILLKDVSISGKGYKPAFVQPIVSGTSYVIKLADGATITVANNSDVTATAAAA